MKVFYLDILKEYENGFVLACGECDIRILAIESTDNQWCRFTVRCYAIDLFTLGFALHRNIVLE